MTYRTFEPHPRHGDDGGARNIGKWVAGLALFLALFVLLGTLQLFQATSSVTAKPALRRVVAAISEIDPLLERHHEDLQHRAQDAAPTDVFQLNEFPVDVELSAGEAGGLSRAELRELLLTRAANVMYDEGTSALRNDERATDTSVGMFSMAGTVDRSLGMLRGDMHTALGVVTIILAVISAGLAALLTALCRGFGRLVALGAVVLLASLALLFGGVMLRLALDVGSGSEFIRAELLDVAHEFAWIPIRNGMAFAVLGAVLFVTGVICARWADRREPNSSLEPA